MLPLLARMLNPAPCLVELVYLLARPAIKQRNSQLRTRSEHTGSRERRMASLSLTTCRHAAARPRAGRTAGCGGVRATQLRSRSGNGFAPSASSSSQSSASSRGVTSCSLKPPPSYGGKAKAKEKKVNPRDLFTFSYRFNTDIPMGETPGASIDEYLMNRPRIVGAVFPDKRKRTKLNDEEWSVQLLPIQFLFLSACPVIAVRFLSRSGGKGYPPHVPVHATSLLLMEVTDYELKGLQRDAMPSHMALTVRGTLYPQPEGRRSLRGQVEMSVGFNLPPVLALVPEPIIRGVGDTVLRQLAEQMKHDFDTGLAADFKKYRTEKLTERRTKH